MTTMIRYSSCLMLVIFFSTGCRKLVNVGDPDTTLGTATIFSSDETALGALMGVYSRCMSAQGSFFNGGNSLLLGLSSDETTLAQPSLSFQAFADNALAPDNLYIGQLYATAYNSIYNVNMLLENVRQSPSLSLPLRRQLMGEALFMRAFIYDRLVRLWGPVPLLTSTNTDVNAVAPRTRIDSVEQQALKDLAAADSLLDTSYAWRGGPPVEHTRPNKWAVEALQARLFAERRSWADAESAATAVIVSGAYQLETAPDSVFQKYSREAIWQLQPVSNTMNTAEGFYFLPVDNAQSRPVFVVRPGLAAAFENGDKRKSWIGTKVVNGVSMAYPAKYKVRTGQPYTEYNMVLRLAEVYLLRAEARVEQGKLIEAMEDINVIRVRAGLGPLDPTDNTDEVRKAIVQERRIELFCEWGHRWIDLQRWGIIDNVMRQEKTGWVSTDQLYPIPSTDIQRNPALWQNAGYP